MPTKTACTTSRTPVRPEPDAPQYLPCPKGIAFVNPHQFSPSFRSNPSDLRTITTNPNRHVPAQTMTYVTARLRAPVVYHKRRRATLNPECPPIRTSSTTATTFRYGRDHLRQIFDYELTPAEKARIRCTAPALNGSVLSQCTANAEFGQNRGGAPFWYHCAIHAHMWRETGRVYL